MTDITTDEALPLAVAALRALLDDDPQAMEVLTADHETDVLTGMVWLLTTWIKLHVEDGPDRLRQDVDRWLDQHWRQEIQ